MPARRALRLQIADGDVLRAGFAQVRRELAPAEEFPAEVLAEAERVAREPDLPSNDRTDLPLITIDPPGSMDLDQALHLEREGRGFRVYYAIADVAAFVAPGGALDREAHVRGLTLYAPDTRVPLHPPVLSEGAASLLPGQIRPALLWDFGLDADGALRTTEVRRALVRSTERFDYATVQARIEAARADDPLLLLAEIGMLLEGQERARGGFDLPIPEQEVVEQNGGYALTYRRALPVEGWNAQLSLLTGMAAAALMLQGGVGVLRTLPPPTEDAVDALRRVASALRVPWTAGGSYAELVRALDPDNAAHAALLQEGTVLLRGAGYTAFSSPAEVPEQTMHGALATPYAHTTAPLRRLVDRYSGEICLALCAGEKVPPEYRDALAALPGEMAEADRRASALERGCLDLVESVILAGREGETFDAAVVDVDGKGAGVVQLLEPAVRGRCEGELPLGAQVRVRLAEADPTRRLVRFVLA